MKKFTFLFATLVVASVLNAQSVQLNNPKDANGLYIVRWDCANEEFATANNFEVDEAFTVAIDITGTPLVAWVAAAPSGNTRSIAFKTWSDLGDIADAAFRLKKIKGNIYGAEYKLSKIPGANFQTAAALTVGAPENYFYAMIFGFEYKSVAQNGTYAEVDWWQNAVQIDSDPATSGDQPVFRTEAYTGTKTSADLVNNDPDFTNATYSVLGNGGYNIACNSQAGVEEIFADAAQIDHFEFYNIQGMKLQAEPAEGLFIAVPFYKNGTRGEAKKVLNRR